MCLYITRSLAVLPFITVGALPIRIVEFIVKYTRTNPVSTWPYGLLMAIPYVTLLTIIFGYQSIHLVFSRPCYLIQERHNNSRRLDVDHNADWVRNHWLTARHFSDDDGISKAGSAGTRAEKVRLSQLLCIYGTLLNVAVGVGSILYIECMLKVPLMTWSLL